MISTNTMSTNGSFPMIDKCFRFSKRGENGQLLSLMLPNPHLLLKFDDCRYSSIVCRIRTCSSYAYESVETSQSENRGLKDFLLNSVIESMVIVGLVFDGKRSRNAIQRSNISDVRNAP